nr:MarR family transcriptional regulator [uncultured bacterium]
MPGTSRKIVDDDERIARLIWLAARGFNRALQIRLNTQNVTFGQWIFLRTLWEEDGLSQRELSDRANLTEPTTHTALLRMEELGYIVRRNVEGNKRRRHAFLTERGKELQGLLEPLAVEVNEIALEGVGADEQALIRRALVKIIENLEKDEANFALKGVRMPPTKLTNT